MEHLFRTNQTCWLAADRELYEHGSDAFYWYDLTDAGTKDFTAAGGLGTIPSFIHNNLGVAGFCHRSAFSFDGVGEYLESANLASTFLAVSNKMVFISLIVDGATANFANPALNDGVVVFPAGFGITIKNNAGAGLATLQIWNADASGVDTLEWTVTIGVPYVVGAFHDGTNLMGFCVKSVTEDYTSTTGNYYRSTASGATLNLAANVRIGRNNGTAYFHGRIGEVLSYNLHQASWVNRCQPAEYMLARYLDRGDPNEFARDRLTRMLWLARAPQENTALGVPPVGLDTAIGSPVGVAADDLSMPEGIDPSGTATEKWRRDIVRVAGLEVSGTQVTLSGPTLRKRHRTMWGPGRPLGGGTQAKRDGDGLLSPYGGYYGMGRLGGKSYGRRRSDGVYEGSGRGDLSLDTDGVVHVGAAQNLHLRSGFQNGLTGWTTSIPAGASIVAEAISLAQYLSEADTQNCILMTQSAGAAADNYIWQTCTPPAAWIGAGTIRGAVGCAHLDAGAGTVAVAVQRTSDLWYYQWDGSWAAGLLWAPLPNRTDRPTFDWLLCDFTVGGAGETFRVRHGQPAGVPASSVNRLFYAHAGPPMPYFCLPIVNGTAVADRGVDGQWVPDYLNARTVVAEQGTGSVWVKTFWDSTDDLTVAGFPQIWFGIFGCHHDSGNALVVWVDHGNSWIEFSVRSGGVTRTARVGIGAWARDTWHHVAWRWTGAAAELGLTARTLSVFLDGVKGTDAVATGAMVETDYGVSLPGAFALPGITLSGSWSLYPLNGVRRRLEVLPDVLTDEEIAAMAAAGVGA